MNSHHPTAAWARGRVRFWPAGVAVLLLLAVAAGLWFWRDDSLRRVQAAGVLRVAYALEAPYAWLAPDGQPVGESPDSARRIAARLGVARIEWVQVHFQDLVPGLREGRFDMVAAGLFITEARQQQVLFSDPTVRVLPALLVAKGNPMALHSYRELPRQPAVRVALLAGSVEERRLRALGLSDPQLLAVPDAALGRAAVLAGRADVLALSLPSLRWMALQSPGAFEVLPDAAAVGGEGADRVAFAFAPGAHTLQRAWNQAQRTWVGGEEHRRMVSALGFVAEEHLAAARPPASQP